MKYILNIAFIMAVLLTTNSCQQTIAENKNTPASSASFNPEKTHIEIIKKYELPAELNEISGMAWIAENTFACVQDEEGILFIYDLKKEQILNKIEFGKRGDYEGLAVNGTTAYVQRADGTIFIIKDFLSANPVVKDYKTFLTAMQNIEGIAYDGINNRLLSVVKDKEPGKVDYKGIYAFDLGSMEMNQSPAFKIPANDNMYKSAGLKKSTFYPSGISIYKPTGNFFIVDGRQAGLLEMNAKGTILKVYSLGMNNFSQAESIAFDDAGNIFISSEAGKDKAHITQIKISK